MVPFGATGSASTAFTSVTVNPAEVPACRKRRLGWVGPSTEENQRSDRGNVVASEW